MPVHRWPLNPAARRITVLSTGPLVPAGGPMVEGIDRRVDHSLELRSSADDGVVRLGPLCE